MSSMTWASQVEENGTARNRVDRFPLGVLHRPVHDRRYAQVVWFLGLFPRMRWFAMISLVLVT